MNVFIVTENNLLDSILDGEYEVFSISSFNWFKCIIDIVTFAIESFNKLGNNLILGRGETSLKAELNIEFDRLSVIINCFR
jgi:hypothetical protein